jgi:hypothetical protein
MYRLLYGVGMDLLTLARNARTSVEMIDRFYASHLQGEQNIAMIQSRRSKKPNVNADELKQAIDALTDEDLRDMLAKRERRKAANKEMDDAKKPKAKPVPRNAVRS